MSQLFLINAARRVTLGLFVAPTLFVAPVLLALLFAGGCKEKVRQSPRSKVTSTEQRKASEGNAMLNAAVARLHDLPELVPLELRPPRIILDARSSTDNQDVVATIGSVSTNLQDLFATGLNTLQVRSQNAGFQRAQLEPGDLVKCYLFPDADTRRRFKETGEMDPNVISYEAHELTVAQVLGPNQLIVSKGLRLPVRVAKELGMDQATLGILDSQGRVNEEGILMTPESLQSLPGVAWPFRIEIWRVRDDQMNEINNRLNKYAEKGEPSLAWEPTADGQSLATVIEFLNQWLRSRPQPADWKPAELLQTLPPKLLENANLAELISAQALGRQTFADHEGQTLQEAIWLRDISRWASGDRFEPVERAAQLFDWSVRNVALDDDLRLIANGPWQTLLYGRGSAAQRAAVFAGLCRQQKIPVMMIEIPLPTTDEQPGNGGKAKPNWLWCAVLHEGELHLFDPQLGLAIRSGEQIATLAQTRQDDSLLRAMDLDDSPYLISSEMLDKATLNVVAEPLALAWRGKEFAKQLSGEEALTLSVDADGLAKQLQKLELPNSVQLWPAPYETLRRQLSAGPNLRNAQRLEFRPYAWRPALWKARTLHFRGLLETEADAKKKGDALYDPVNDHRAAAQSYSDRSVRPSDINLANITPIKARIYSRAKTDATYWLGLLQHEQGKYGSARNWLENQTLANAEAKHWQAGVRYNRARTYEAMGETKQAIELLEADDSLQQHGNRLRAKRLSKESEPPATPEATDKPTGEPTDKPTGSE